MQWIGEWAVHLRNYHDPSPFWICSHIASLLSNYESVTSIYVLPKNDIIHLPPKLIESFREAAI